MIKMIINQNVPTRSNISGITVFVGTHNAAFAAVDEDTIASTDTTTKR